MQTKIWIWSLSLQYFKVLTTVISYKKLLASIVCPCESPTFSQSWATNDSASHRPPISKKLWTNWFGTVSSNQILYQKKHMSMIIFYGKYVKLTIHSWISTSHVLFPVQKSPAAVPTDPAWRSPAWPREQVWHHSRSLGEMMFHVVFLFSSCHVYQQNWTEIMPTNYRLSGYLPKMGVRSIFMSEILFDNILQSLDFRKKKKNNWMILDLYAYS